MTATVLFERLRKLKPDRLVRKRREKFLRMGQFNE